MRVSKGLARGIAVAAVFLCGDRLGDSAPSPLHKTLAYIRSQDFTPVFAVARQRVEAHFSPQKERDFLETLFSISGKWKALTRSKRSYERHVARSFEKIVLDPAELARLSEAIRQDWIFAVAGSENRLLGVVYEDLRPFRPELTALTLRRQFAGVQTDLLPMVLQDLGLNVVSIAGAEAAVSILTGVIASTATAGEAAGTAAIVGGPWTFGASLAVGLAVGILIDQTAGEAYEDVARTQLRLQVNEIRNQMIDQVYDALARAVFSTRKLQEECVRALYEGRPDDRLAARR